MGTAIAVMIATLPSSLPISLATAHSLSRRQDRFHDLGVANAAAQVSRDGLSHILLRSAFDLVQDMVQAQATGTRKELDAQLCKVDLVAIEDLGMRRLPPTAAEDLLEVLARRYEKSFIILTTNRPLQDWGQVLRTTSTTCRMASTTTSGRSS